jgi:hypothetical protein
MSLRACYHEAGHVIGAIRGAGIAVEAVSVDAAGGGGRTELAEDPTPEDAILILHAARAAERRAP